MTDETDLSAFQVDQDPFVSAEHDGKTWVSHLFLAPIKDGAEGDNSTVLENCPRYFVYRAKQQGVIVDPEPLEVTIQGTWPDTPVFVRALFRIVEDQ